MVRDSDILTHHSSSSSLMMLITSPSRNDSSSSLSALQSYSATHWRFLTVDAAFDIVDDTTALVYKQTGLHQRRSSTSKLDYIVDDIQLVTDSDRRQLRSAAARTCLVPRTHNNFGDRSFGAAGLRVWNSLPLHLRRDMNFARFKRQLKTFLFGS